MTSWLLLVLAASPLGNTRPSHDSSVEVELQGCANINAQEAETLIGIELAAARVTVAPGSRAITVKARCDVATLHIVIDDVVAGVVTASLPWHNVEPSARTRRFTLAVSETLISERRDRQAAAAISVAKPAAPKAEAAGPLDDIAVRRPIAAKMRSSVYAQLGVLQLGQSWSWSPRLAMGIVRPVAAMPKLAAVLEMDAFSSTHALPMGEVQLVSGGLTPAVRAQHIGADTGAFLQVGITMALATLAGHSPSLRLQEERHLVGWFGPAAAGGAQASFGAWTFGLAVNAVFNVRGIDGQAVSGSRTFATARFSGLLFGGGMTLAHRF